MYILQAKTLNGWQDVRQYKDKESDRAVEDCRIFADNHIGYDYRVIQIYVVMQIDANFKLIT